METKSALSFAILVLFSFIIAPASAQSVIRGTVSNQKKEVLPFASVSVKGTSLGTIANEDGKYELALQPGFYEIVYQYLGYQAGIKPVTLAGQIETFNAVLAEQALELGEVRVGRGNEDPAYAIMRRAIAKSRYHLLQVESYRARAYTKSSVVITDLPLEFLYKKELEKVSAEENFKKGVPILNETVSEIEFRQPNHYKQKVVASRNSQDNSFASPNEYLLSSFYKPEVVQTVSPLSPKAFAYYKFEYLGTYRENDVNISKIRLIPRSYGDGVFKGTIHIIDDLWAIHSLDLQTVKMGINLRIRQIYNPVDKVWMPIQQQFNADGGLYGVKGKADYVISQTFQSIVLNPSFPPDVIVLDQKKDREEIKTLPNLPKRTKDGNLSELLSTGEKLSTKQLRKAVRDFEKQQFRESRNKGEDVDMEEKRISSTEIDSMATRREVAFWDSLRTVPLTTREKASYNRLDSLNTHRKIESVSTKKEGATVAGEKRNSAKKVSIGNILWKASFPLTKDKSWRLDYSGPLKGVQINTVEGLVFDGTGVGVRHSPRGTGEAGKKSREFTAKGLLRYSLERNLLSPRGEARYRWRHNTLSAEGGRTISQFNPENPISFLLNSFTTLFFEQNFAKIYQKDYLKFQYSNTRNNDHFRFNLIAEYADRTGLGNAEKMNRYRWINWHKREYTSNTPEVIQSSGNLTGDDLPINNHVAVTIGTEVSYKPWQRYKIKNGKTTYYRDDSPELSLSYRKGLNDILGSQVDFDFLQLKIRHGFPTGIRSKLYYQIGAGTFLTDKSLFFPDYHQFAGNRFFFQFGDPVGTFRMLDYYRFSTGKHFAEAHVLAEFRQFLFTQLEWFRRYGIKETLIFNFLTTPQPAVSHSFSRPGNYAELGYGFDVGIRLPFRVEIVNSFENFRYTRTGVRIGTTLNIPFQ